MPLLCAEHLCVSFGNSASPVRALRDVTTDFREGEFTLVRGPSGSGKSTLLAVLAGLIIPDAGQVSFGDVCLTSLSSAARACFRLTHVGFVFQSFQLFDTLSALENVALPMQIAGVPARVARHRAASLLELVDVAQRGDLPPKRLSGGEQQRTAVARALALDPILLLADEPTASLDGENGKAIARLLQWAAHDRGRLVMAISHDERLLPFADRIVTMTDGAIVADERIS